MRTRQLVLVRTFGQICRNTLRPRVLPRAHLWTVRILAMGDADKCRRVK